MKSKPDHLFPIALDLRGRRVLVAGAGHHADEKARMFSDAGAVVLRAGDAPHADLIASSHFILYAGQDKSAAQRWFDLCESQAKWFCSVDDPDRCSVYLPAIARHGPVVAAVSTSGRSPTLARVLKDRLQSSFESDDVGALAEFLGESRLRLNGRLESFQARKQFWEDILHSDVPEILRSEGAEAAHRRASELLESKESRSGAGA